MGKLEGLVVATGGWVPKGLLKATPPCLPTAPVCRGWEGSQEGLSVGTPSGLAGSAMRGTLAHSVPAKLSVSPSGLGSEVAGVGESKGIVMLQGMQWRGKTFCSSIALQKDSERLGEIGERVPQKGPRFPTLSP